VLVTGGTGMVGAALVARLAAEGHEALTASRASTGPPGAAAHLGWDLTADELPSALLETAPEVVVHAAAFTDVDAAERDADLARSVNVEGTRRVVGLTQACGARLVYLSTDGVFDGRLGGYRDTDEPAPVNVYSVTKHEGEQVALAHHGALVVRFNVIGPAALSWWILDAARQSRAIQVFRDVRFSPLEVRELAGRLALLATATDLTGVCHLAADEVVSKAEYARRLVDAAGLADRAAMTEVDQPEIEGRAPRPRDTSLVLSQRLAGIVTPPSLESAIRRLAAEYRREHQRTGSW